MTDSEKREAAKHFSDYWKGKGYEKGESQPFWLSLLGDVCGVEHASEYIVFEDQVHIDNTSFIDGFIPSTRVLIEQKSLNKNLKSPITQSDGTKLTPKEQAMRYVDAILHERGISAVPRWVVICNFACFHIYDMESPKNDPIEIKLEDLPKEFYRLDFLIKKSNAILQKEKDLSLEAGTLVGNLYDALSKQYGSLDDPVIARSLNILCVRIVFCLYAEDSGVFPNRLMFHDFLDHYKTEDLRDALISLFEILDTPYEKRSKYIKKELANFPYVNGALFDKSEEIEIPPFTEAIRHVLIDECSAGFDWSEISPTIFGALFESTLNPDTRREGGMHFTPIENIHRVIDPLFLNDLLNEFEVIKQIPDGKKRIKALSAFQDKIASLRFLDPACGSGNFLTESYLSLRRLENRIIDLYYNSQIMFGEVEHPIKVSISQFYGIEINDFAVSVSKAALWIAENQMMKETEKIVNMNLDFLPLTTNAFIKEGNALAVDWNDVISKYQLSYIMGNPPFYGASKMTARQKQEVVALFGKGKRVNSIDYVGGWYYKAAAMMQGTKIKAALVSTNSITQGEQVAPMWGPLIDKYHVEIQYAYRTFQWDSEATIKAHVHCVIIGFTCYDTKEDKYIYDGEDRFLASRINPYLQDAPDVLLESRGKPICDVPLMTYGNKPTDDGNFILTKEEAEEMIKNDPSIASCIRRYIGAKDFINGKEERYCLWLKGVSPAVYANNKEISKRLEKIRKFRETSSAKPTRDFADRPYLFFSTPQTDSNFLCIPEVSSDKRKYIPIGFMDKTNIASNKLLIVPDATLYEFGVLTSNVHMAWVRAFSGRLETRYQYSAATVYNTFPWPSPSAEQKKRIMQTAQAILDARAQYPDCSLSVLYNRNKMPNELITAHQKNDNAVWEAYGKKWAKSSEEDCVFYLMKLYEELVAGK